MNGILVLRQDAQLIALFVLAPKHQFSHPRETVERKLPFAQPISRFVNQLCGVFWVYFEFMKLWDFWIFFFFKFAKIQINSSYYNFRKIKIHSSAIWHNFFENLKSESKILFWKKFFFVH